MAFPQYDIAQSGQGKFVLAKINRDDPEFEQDQDELACEIVGVFETEQDARLQLLRILATSPGQPMVYDTQGFGRWIRARAS